MDDKYMQLAVKVENVDARAKSIERRVDDLEVKMDAMQETQITLVKLANGVENIADQLVDMKEDIKDVKTSQREMSDKVNILENKPALDAHKRINNIIEKVLWLIVGGVIVFLLSGVFPDIPF